MKRAFERLRSLAEAFDAADDPNEPAFDPVHLGGALVLVLVAIGALYWTLWTLLVYEGGLFGKLLPAAELLLRLKTAGDFGYRGAWDRGVFEGWAGNLGALLATVGIMTALFRLYSNAASRAKK